MKWEVYEDALLQYGPDKVLKGFLVIVCKIKRDANGNITRYTVRWTYCDKDVNIRDTFSATTASNTVRYLANITLSLRAHHTTNDVGGAYY